MKKTDKFDAAMARQLNKAFDNKHLLPKARELVKSKILPEIRKAAAEGKNYTEFILCEKTERGNEPTTPDDLAHEREEEIVAMFCASLLSRFGFEADYKRKHWSNVSEFGTPYSGWKMIIKFKW